MVNLTTATPTTKPIKQEKASIKPLLLTKDSFKSDAEISAGRTTIIYGNSGDGKTTLLYDFARRTHAETGAHFRLISAEDSTKTIFLPLIREGVVEALFVSGISKMLSSLNRLARGEWPTEEGDWRLWDYSADYYLIEGLTSIAEEIQQENRKQGRFLGEQAPSSVVEDGERFSMPSQFGYGFAQLQTLQHVRDFGMIPKIKRVIWTSHEIAAFDSNAGEKIHGPALVGNARTPAVQKYCGILLHLDCEVPKQGPIIRKLWWQKHPDPLAPLFNCPSKVTLPIEAWDKFSDLVGNRNYYEVTIKDGHLQGSLYDLFKAEQSAINAVGVK